MGDDLLVMRSERGASAVLRGIYDKYRDYLLIVAIALCHDVNLAEDAVHDVFVAFARGLDKFELTGSLKAYLATCVANRVRDLMRRKEGQAVSLEQARVVAAGLSEPSQAIACNEQLQKLGSALNKLPFEQREVIVLHIYARMRFGVIAKSLGVSVNTVKGRYRYGIHKLRLVLDSEAHE
jgi:RNA polymerase sigma-70 factor (ECF subfamily)